MVKRDVEDVSEAIIGVAVERDIEVLFVRNNPDLDRVGNIAARPRYQVREGQTGAFA